MGRKKLSQEEFINRCVQEHPEYDYSKTIYVNANSDIIVTCPIHGDFITRPSRFIMGAKCGCPKCNRGFLKDPLTQDIFIERCKQYFPDYDYSQVIYKGIYEKVIITCNKHNYTWEVRAKDLMNGHGCPKCGKESSIEKQVLSLYEFINRSNIIHKNKYDYSKTVYTNYITKVTITCPEHGEFEQTPANHLKGEGCPRCHTQSKGESLIEDFLKDNNIVFIKQYSIECPINNSGKARIDFYLPDINCFIEYNGKQHYVPIEYFGGQLKFEQQQRRDQFIRDYCYDNNIRLIEIKYDDNVLSLLKNELGY